VIHSTATLTVNTFSNASTTGVSAANTGFNIAGSSSGESVAGATSDVIATGVGIRGGPSALADHESDADVIRVGQNSVHIYRGQYNIHWQSRGHGSIGCVGERVG
jgi:hypothetical protein